MKSPLEYGKDFIMKPKIDFAFKKAGVSLTDNKLHDVDIPGTFVPNCLLISDLQKSDKLEIISSFK